MPLNSRRPVYFAFQGLLMAVLLLLCLQQPAGVGAQWTYRLIVVSALFSVTLAMIRFVPDSYLANGWFQTGLFLGDAAAATVILRWVSPHPDIFLIYVLILFGTALTRRPGTAVAVAGATLALYLAGGWQARTGFPISAEFWLKALFLIVSTALLAILSHDAAQAQAEMRRRFDERLIQVERVATLGRAAAEVAHRIKGPLTTIAVDADLLMVRHAADAATIKELSQIREEVERCKGILKNLLDLGRIEEMDVVPLDARAPIGSAIKQVLPFAADRDVRAVFLLPEEPMRIRGDATLIQVAVHAIVQNAIEASEPGGVVRVAAASSQGRWRVSVEDAGAGIEKDQIEKIFEPFFTTKPEGSGLGLSAALRIAQKHGGTIEVESAGPGKGSRFTLLLPIE